jgi:hypothetical protein
MMEDADAQLHKWNSNKSDRLEDDRIFFLFSIGVVFLPFLSLWQGSSNFLARTRLFMRSLYPALAINSLYLCFIAAGEV